MELIPKYQRRAVRAVVKVIYCSLVNSDSRALCPLWLMTWSEPNNCLHIPAERTLAASFRAHPPLACFHFQRACLEWPADHWLPRTTPTGTRFLPGKSHMSRMCVRCARPPHGKHSALEKERKKKKSQRVPVSATRHGKLWWFIFGELLRFREHTFPDAHVNWCVCGVHRYAWYAHTHTVSRWRRELNCRDAPTLFQTGSLSLHLWLCTHSAVSLTMVRGLGSVSGVHLDSVLPLREAERVIVH